MKKLLALVSIAFMLGCIGTEPSTPGTTTHATSTIAQETTSTTSTSSTTTLKQTINKTAICIEAKERETLYERCKRYPPGSLSLPVDERMLCANITRNHLEYLRGIVNDLRGCQYIKPEPAESDGQTSFCKDLEDQGDRDDCYMTFRLCDKIADETMKQRCKASTSLQ